MLFHTIKFFIFFLTVYTLYINLPLKWQNRMLLVASYIFYGSWDWRFLSLIVISTVVDYYCGQKIYAITEKKYRKKFLILSLITNLGLLGFFKYFNFFAGNFKNFALLFGWQVDIVTLNIILPVGISFYTFQTLSYTIDIYRGKLKPEKSFFDFALFVAFFPQLVAGPIERAKNLLPQIKSERFVNYPMIKEGLWLILYGLFLKIFVADNMAKIADHVFIGDSAALSGIECLFGVYAFAFQIFGDFAGYSSMAIGISKLMGIHLMTNFLYPYFVTNPSDFWKNWHISLSTWLRDYLYIPLGGNRNGENQTYRNLAITMFLGGLWHGAAWTFIVWGIYQGIILIIHRLMTTKIKIPQIPLVFRLVGMFHITCFGWLIFRAQSLRQIGVIASNIFVNFNGQLPSVLSAGKSILFYSWLLILIQVIQMKKRDQLAIANLPKVYKNMIYLAIMGSIAFTLATTFIAQGKFNEQPFIYFQF